MKTKKRYATAYFEQLRPAKVSNYILSLDQLKPGTLVVIYWRVSKRSQKPKAAARLELFKKVIEDKYHCRVIAVFSEVVPGHIDMYQECHRGRPELVRAARQVAALIQNNYVNNVPLAGTQAETPLEMPTLNFSAAAKQPAAIEDGETALGLPVLM